MLIDKYRIINPTLAFVLQGGRHIPHTVPKGAIVTVNRMDSEKVVAVTWDGMEVMMSAQDLANHGEKILVYFPKQK